MPDYLSTQTIENTVIIKEILALHNFDAGNIQAKRTNGDMVWYTLTADDDFSSVLIFIVTSDAILSEYCLADGVYEVSVITNIGEFVEWLRLHNFRRLSTEEWNIWSGKGRRDSGDDEFPTITWDESG